MSNRRASHGLLRPGENCCAVALAPRVGILIDAATYFDAFRRAAQQAEREILIIGWDFNSRAPLAPGVPVGPFLNALARKKRHLHVRILDWDFPILFQHDRELPPLLGLGFKTHRRVHFRVDSARSATGSQHQKVVVIDGQLAFVGGIDIAARRWDTSAHRPDDSRRVVGHTPYPPVHDVMAVVDGAAAQALATVARERWLRATGEALAGSETDRELWPGTVRPDFQDVAVGIACTAPATADTPEVRDVERLYIDMIARARRYVYIENQYFTSHAIGQALARRLREATGPEIVVVTRLQSHGWLEEVTMQALRTRLIRQLRQADRHGRLHIYYAHQDGLADGTCIDVHAKLAIVDDQWLRVGSANISNRSMGLDSECDILIDAAARPDASASVRRVRNRLLAEHLGCGLTDVEAEIARTSALHGAIAKLGTGPRTLRALADEPAWSDSALDAIAVADPERPVSFEALVGQLAPAAELRPAVVTWRRALLMGAVLLGLAALWRWTPLSRLATVESIRDVVRTFGSRRWAAPLLIAAYLPASVIVFPRPLLTLAAVLAFGPWAGLACAVAGNMLAAFSVYLAGRLFERDHVQQIAGHRVAALGVALQSRGLVAITALRLVPVAPFAIENLVAGAIRIRLRDFLLGTFLGMLPGELASTVFGREMHSALFASSPLHYLPIVGVVLLLAAAAFVARRQLIR